MRDLTGILFQYSIHKKTNKNGGVFLIPHFKGNKSFQCIASKDEDGWEHLSFVLVKMNGKRIRRVSNYEEICFIKSIFFKEDEPAIQIHPPKKDHINNHNYCLHLWNHKNLIFPHSSKVGFKEFNN